MSVLQQQLKGKRALGSRESLNSAKIFPYLFILPVYIMLFLFVLKPFLFAIIKSFYEYDGIGTDNFIGFQNYIRLFTNDEKFWISLRNMLVFFAGLFVAFPFSVIAAELIFNLKSDRLQGVFRSLIIIPIVVPSVVIYLVWKFMYYPGIGAFANVCEALNIPYPNFLGDVHWVKPSLIFMGFPWISGLNFLMSYAALQGIDGSLFEAAKIDGCKTFRRVFTIDIPLIIPQLKALFVLGIVGLMQGYEKMLIVTEGGPQNASLVPGLHMYNVAFKNSPSMFGYACAMAVVLFIVTFALSTLTLKAKKGE